MGMITMAIHLDFVHHVVDLVGMAYSKWLAVVCTLTVLQGVKTDVPVQVDHADQVVELVVERSLRVTVVIVFVVVTQACHSTLIDVFDALDQLGIANFFLAPRKTLLKLLKVVFIWILIHLIILPRHHWKKGQVWLRLHDLEESFLVTGLATRLWATFTFTRHIYDIIL